MKPQNVLRLLLLMPFAMMGTILIIFIMLFTGHASGPSEATPGLGNLVAMLFTIFGLGAYFWLVPYTLLALGLFIWSRGKSFRNMALVFVFSPVMLAVLMAIELPVLWAFHILGPEIGGFGSAIAIGLLMSVVAVPMGYLFVLIGIVVCVALGYRSLFDAGS